MSKIQPMKAEDNFTCRLFLFLKRSSEGYAVGLFEPAAPKLLLTEIAELLEVELKTLEG
jgi:hypothetical protein